MSSSTASLHCPNCGGDVQPERANCPWCDSTLSTISCPSCFASIFNGMKHCPYCGKEATKAKTSQSGLGTCPRCELQLKHLEIGNSELNECGRCGGLWVAKETFQKICEDREKQEAVLGLDGCYGLHPPENSRVTQRLYIPCPVCKTLMNRLNFAGCSGVVIDWCKPHGTWLDYNELPRIIDFIHSGGLKKSRDRQKEEIHAEAQNLRWQEHTPAAERARLAGTQPTAHWEDEGNNILDFLSSVWKGLNESK